MSTLTQLFTSIANAIREKTGAEGPILAENFSNEILNIPTGRGEEDYNIKVDASAIYDSSYGLSSIINEVKFFDTSKYTTMKEMFSKSNIKKIPLFDTSNVINFNSTFFNCRLLEEVPILDTRKVTNFESMFYGCPKLSDESLNNILQMCINATSYTSIKTLNKLGFRKNLYPLDKITSLSNYQDFLDAGWTIGY